MADGHIYIPPLFSSCRRWSAIPVAVVTPSSRTESLVERSGRNSRMPSTIMPPRSAGISTQNSSPWRFRQRRSESVSPLRAKPSIRINPTTGSTAAMPSKIMVRIGTGSVGKVVVMGCSFLPHLLPPRFAGITPRFSASAAPCRPPVGFGFRWPAVGPRWPR